MLKKQELKMASIFTKIINREIPSDIVFENDEIIAIKDINPQAPLHILVIPKKEIPSVAEAEDADELILGRLLLCCKNIARDLNLNKGYRLIINTGDEGGQTVPHLHIHILGGTHFSEGIVPH